MWDERDELTGRHTESAWPIALRKMVGLLAEIKRVSPLEAARLIWLEGTEILGFPVGWQMTGIEIGLVKSKIGELIKQVQVKHTKLHEGNNNG